MSMNSATPIYSSTPPPSPWSNQLDRHSQRSSTKFDPERANELPQKQNLEHRVSSSMSSTAAGDNSSWNLFRKPTKHRYEEIGSRRNAQIHSVSEDVDPNNRVCYYSRINESQLNDFLISSL
jgi:hypothetical protein